MARNLGGLDVREHGLVGVRLRSKLRDERLMLRISGSAIGYIQTMLFPIMLGAFYDLDGWLYYLLLSYAWATVLLLLLYYAKRIAAVTLIFTAFAPLFTQFGLLFFHPFPFFEPSILWWTCNTAPIALLLVAVEYSIKLFLASRAERP